MTAELPYHQNQQNNIGVKPPTPLHTVPHRTAFAPAAPAARSATALSAEQSRADFLRAGFAAAATTSAAALVLSPSEASAAKYGPLGRGSPEVVDPKTADVDLDVLSSGAVQKAYRNVKGYQTTVEGMKSTLTADPQADIGPSIRKNLDFVQLRSDFNAVNAALDEDSQRGTDRLIRAVIQDITELEAANRQKPGVPRSTIRLNTMVGKLDKLSKAFNDFLAFVPAVKERAPPPPPAPVEEAAPAAAPATE